MEFLIPGLILVAVMAWLSTRIKKGAAAAFEPESIDTDSYTLEKPEGFLHVIGHKDHEFMAYSNEFGERENSRTRKGTIELDILPDTDVASVSRAIREAADSSKVRSGDTIEADERANKTDFRCVYKLIPRDGSVYRLRFAVIAEHFDEYSGKIDNTIDSFVTKPS